MPLPQTKASLIDRLGAVRQSIADLKHSEVRLTQQVAELGEGYHQGKMYAASVAPIVDVRGGFHVTVTRKGSKR
jgi:hypothetical protein